MGHRTASDAFQCLHYPLPAAEGSEYGPPRVALSPVLREYVVDTRDATLRRHPLLGVQAVLIVGLLRSIHRHLPLHGPYQWLEGRRVQQGAWRSRQEQGGCTEARRKGSQVV